MTLRTSIFNLGDVILNREIIGYLSSTSSLNIINQNNNKENEEIKSHQQDDIIKKLFCNSCKVEFQDIKERNYHYKSEWHTYNLILKMNGAQTISLKEYEDLKLINEEEEQSSSDDEQDDELKESNDEIVRNFSPKITFVSSNNKIYTLWKCILLNKSHHNKISQYLDAFYSLNNKKKWTILLCHGGYFAGAIFEENNVICHKRICRYTTRRKQGGTQSTKDKSKSIKSAGSYIRRVNEVKLKEDILKTLTCWKTDLDTSNLIFIFAPNQNRTYIFSENSPLDKKDDRVRDISFTTMRPSFKEVKRVHLMLSTVEVEYYEKKEDIKNIEEGDEIIDDKGDEIIDNKVDEPENTETNKEQLEVEDNVDLLLRAIESRDTERIKYLLEQEEYVQPIPKDFDAFVPAIVKATTMKDKEILQILIDYDENINAISPQHNNRTSLHIASMMNEESLVLQLLKNGANPEIKDKYNKVAYDLCTDKKVRRAFRIFAGENPGLWDYRIAHIEPLTVEMEELMKKKQKEKKKMKKKKRKEKKDKEPEEKSNINQVQEDDQDELERKLEQERDQKFKNIPDRLKGYQAYLIRSGELKCSFCSNTITALPFERLTYKYCSTKCVVSHMKQLNSK